jgi:hypothetical protein
MAWAALGTSASAVDLLKIDRRIAKEPDYQQSPKYCLLVFGPEAKTRVWLVLDGNDLHVDRNGNGDLTDAGERVGTRGFFKSDDPRFLEVRSFDAGDIPDGPLKHTRLNLIQYRVRPNFTPQFEEDEQLLSFARKNPNGLIAYLSISVELQPRPGAKVRIVGRLRQSVQRGDARGYLQFADKPEDAPIVHFNGPLQMAVPYLQVLRRGDKATEFKAVVGTPGLGDGTLAIIDPNGLIAENEHPLAEIEFPSRKPGEPAIKSRLSLPYRIAGDEFYGILPVPKEAGDGKARITLSFPDCEEVPIGSCVVEANLEAIPKVPAKDAKSQPPRQPVDRK